MYVGARYLIEAKGRRNLWWLVCLEYVVTVTETSFHSRQRLVGYVDKLQHSIYWNLIAKLIAYQYTNA